MRGKRGPIGAVTAPKAYEKAISSIDDTAKAPSQPAEDPWVHRSKGMRCRSCMWFVVKPSNGGIDPVRGPLGRCRRHAPTLGGFPVVYADLDFCGDHKLS